MGTLNFSSSVFSVSNVNVAGTESNGHLNYGVLFSFHSQLTYSDPGVGRWVILDDFIKATLKFVVALIVAKDSG